MARSPSPLLVLGLAASALVYSYFDFLKFGIALRAGLDVSLSGWIVFVTGLLFLFLTFYSEFHVYFIFVWHCFLAPLGQTSDQKARLDKFYQGQAQVYDKTRSRLLRGRNTMLSMAATHLRVLRTSEPTKRLVWVDVGGGTGWNVEAMDAHMPISSFDAVYVVDLCQPLLDVAQQRFKAKGWNNVICLCQDATTFTLPEWSDGVKPKGSLGLITLSYSLSMIPSYHTLLDRLDYLLDPKSGLIAVADFYTSTKHPSQHEKAIGGVSKQCGWLSRWFWQIWFDFDHVDLSPGKRSYLEYRFGTIKSYNGRNHFLKFIPFIVRIPYYVWVGCSRERDTTTFQRAFEQEGCLVGNPSPLLVANNKNNEGMEDLTLGEPALAINDSKDTGMMEITPPLSSFHYQLGRPWRLPYFDSPVHAEFRTFIYSFTWEDPEEDMRHLNLSSNDTVFAITSAGDNVLHYAINAGVKRVHAVDMNPCQGHLLELKLAALKSLDYDTFFSLFGLGHVPSSTSFRTLLDSTLSPYLSSEAYTFWRYNSNAFSSPDSTFYRRGYSGWALRLAGWFIRMAGKTEEVKKLCEARTIDEQRQMWEGNGDGGLRALFVENWIMKLVVASPVFLWNALGVPKNQKSMITDEGSIPGFILDTLDPIGSHALLSQGAYHYLLCLLGHYTPESCPDYLTRSGFDALRANDAALMDAFRLHTDSIANVLSGLENGTLTRAIVMDHLDWFSPSSPSEVICEITELHRVLTRGGMVFWRSAAKYPWYRREFEKAGFEITPLGMREGDGSGKGKAIDRVNMYASFWKAVKL